MSNNYIQEEAQVVQEQAKGWFSSLDWRVKLAIPAVAILIGGTVALSVVSGVWRKATTITSLNPEQLQIVEKAAEKAFSAYKEDSNGKVVVGILVSCSTTDTDPPGTKGYGKVTCKGRIPQVITSTAGPTVRMIDRDAQCTVPKDKVSGCKLD